MVRAAFLAAAAGTPIDMRRCIHAAEREYLEMGKLTCAPQAAEGPTADHERELAAISDPMQARRPAPPHPPSSSQRRRATRP